MQSCRPHLSSQVAGQPGRRRHFFLQLLGYHPGVWRPVGEVLRHVGWEKGVAHVEWWREGQRMTNNQAQVCTIVWCSAALSITRRVH